MTKKEIHQMAEKMGVEGDWAIRKRVDLLKKYIKDEKFYRERIIKNYKTQNNETKEMIKLSYRGSKSFSDKHQREIDRLTLPPSSNPDAITDDDIEAARAHPFTNLLELKGNRCIAFCHESDSYSMSYSAKANKLHCHVCDKNFNPIDYLIHQGYSFIDAVKQLK